MVLKRWSYIFIAAWLINALVCFHPSTYYQGGTLVAAQSSILEDSDNVLVDIVLNHVIDANDDHDHQHNRIAHRNKFVNPRSVDFNIQLPSIQYFEYFFAAAKAPVNYLLNWDNKPLLPPLYHFLFRLSPF